jgi:hypothetical protein
MNTLSFGRHFWNFKHDLPYLFPEEVLSQEDAVNIVLFIHYFPFILPCHYCSDSAQIFEKRMETFYRISVIINGNRYVTRALISEYFYDFHNIVNRKLGKPQLQLTWRDALIIERPPWQDSFWNMVIILIFNF